MDGNNLNLKLPRGLFRKTLNYRKRFGIIIFVIKTIGFGDARNCWEFNRASEIDFSVVLLARN